MHVTTLLLRRCPGVLDAIVLTLVDESREFLLASLASVHSVPAVVHVRVESVVIHIWIDVPWQFFLRVFILLVLDVDWLLISCHAVGIKTIDQHNSNVNR